ncbi:hypothetical protein [Rathayibacter agropyri]|uniref:hypothetical protein n=1 Tax=Rathayibacter agropyri TaxID=1634927 RepID=UPI0015676F73|nr:hypothetical protein [Rathayibacter agropyri]NRD09385.1 hypothetical protein [Rathayibacter agropyri]
MSLVVALTGCSADPALTTAPSSSEPSNELKMVISAIDSGDPSRLTELFPDQQPSAIAAVYNACSAIAVTSRRIDSQDGDSPRTLYATLSGPLEADESTEGKCSFLLYWTDNQTWRLNST